MKLGIFSFNTEYTMPAAELAVADPFSSLAAAAAVTEKILLGTGVSLVIEHEPLYQAKQVATLDRISNGRFLFGVGAGWIREEMQNHGTPPNRRWQVF